jgi:hypothetical protein
MASPCAVILVAFRASHLRHAEVENFDGSVAREKHVGRLDIAVNDADGVRGGEPKSVPRAIRAASSMGSFPSRCRRSRTVSPSSRSITVGTSPALTPALRISTMSGMLQLAERAPLVAHARDEILPRRQRAQERLQYVTALELDVLDFVDRTHTARAQQTHHAIRRTRDDLPVLIFANPAGVGHEDP